MVSALAGPLTIHTAARLTVARLTVARLTVARFTNQRDFFRERSMDRFN